MLAVADLIRTMLPLFPRKVRQEVENDLPSLRIALQRLGLEVLASENEGTRYVDAVEQPTFPLMARVHHGMLDLLQWRVPPGMLDGLRMVCKGAARGDFDPMRRLLFAVAARKNDPDAAAARFLLFQAVRMNLYLWTWNKPEAEAWGCVGEIEDDAQEIVESFLDSPEVHGEEVRPLHLLVTEMILRLGSKATRFAKQLRGHVGAVIEEMVEMTEAMRAVRAMEATDAALFRPGRSPEKPGSQRISDRYPWHFPSANAVDQRRSRLRKRLDPECPPESPGDRVVDIFLAELEAEDA